MKFKIRRIVSVILTLAIIVGLFSQIQFGAFAATVTHDVTGDAANNLNLTSNYDVSLNATNITVGVFTQEMLDTNLVKPDKITLQKLSGDAAPSLSSSTSWNNIVDGSFDCNGTHKSFAYVGNMGDTGAKLTIDLGAEYTLSDFYLLSAYHAYRSIYKYDVFVGNDKDALYNDDNLVFSYNYDGYKAGNGASFDAVGKLNTADGGKNAEGQIYTFTGSKKPTGSFIGVKVTGMGKYTGQSGWFYISELGAHGLEKANVNVSGDIFSNPNFTYESNYDLSLNATDIPVGIFTQDMLDTNIVKPEKITLQKMSGDVAPSLTWNKVIDGDFDCTGTHNSYAFATNMDVNGVKLTIDLGVEYTLSDFYILSAYHAYRSIYEYEIFVGNDKDALYNDNNLVFSYNYDGYKAGNNASADAVGKLNAADGGKNAEGQIYTFTGSKKPTGSFIGVKITGMGKYTGQPGWFYISELGAHGTKISGCDEHEGRDMTIKSSVQDTTIFDSDVMYQETAFFCEGRDEYQLLYPIDEIITVRSYDLKTEYHEGIDFSIKDGKLYLTENTDIPLYDNTPAAGSDPGYWKTNQWKYQLNISYTHSKNWDDNALYVKGLDGKLSDISKFHEKASSGETTNVIFIGDSITEGHNASGLDNVKVSIWAQDENKVDIPARDTQHNVHVKGWQEYFGLSSRPDWANDSWAKQVGDALAAKYGDNIVMTNRGIGSTSAGWINKYDNIQYLLGEGEGTSNLPTPDIAFIAYGMNESGNSNEVQINYTKKIVDFLRGRNPDCSIVFVSAFVPCTTKSAMIAGLAGHEQAYYEYAEEIGNATVAPVNAVFQSVLSAKQGMDYTGNMFNHPNDFGVNIYADTILAVLEGKEATVDLNSNVDGIKPTYTGSTLVGGQITVAAPEVDGYTFSHFEINGQIVAGDQANTAIVSMTSNMIVNAVYTINKYTVTFKVDGEVVKTQTVEYGAAATAPVVEDKYGYTFGGWDKAFDEIKADTDVNGAYTLTGHVVTFKSVTGVELGKVVVAEGDAPDYDAVKDINANVKTVYGYNIMRNDNGDVVWDADVYGTGIVNNITVTPRYEAIEGLNTNVKVYDVDGTKLIDQDARYDSAIYLASRQGAKSWTDAKEGGNVLIAEPTGTLYACGSAMEIYAKAEALEAEKVAIVGKNHEAGKGFSIFAHVNVEGATAYGFIFASSKYYNGKEENKDFRIEDLTPNRVTNVEVNTANVEGKVDFMTTLNYDVEILPNPTRYARAYVVVNNEYIYSDVICNK